VNAQPSSGIKAVSPSAAVAGWHLALLVIALFGLLRFVLPALGTLPRNLTGEEADALFGAQLLCEKVAAPTETPTDDQAEGGARPTLKERLKAGFETTSNHPRLATLAPDKGYQRAVVEAPLPRWLGALGIGVLPTSDAATNLERASSASALAVALALAVLVWSLRRHGLIAWIAPLVVLALPGVVDAALSAGHGASALFVSAMFLMTLDRVLEQRAGLFGQLALGGIVGLALGIYPMALVLYLVVLVSWSIRHRGVPSSGSDLPTMQSQGTLGLPSLPLSLLVLPVIALVALIAIWPALWNETGKRLGSWIVDAGSAQSPPHEVLGIVYDQASGRSAQAFTALLQWVAWTPLPVLGLWLVGLARAMRDGRAGAWPPIVMLAGCLVVGACDGGLFGGRNSLLALMWVPTAITAAHGIAATLAFLEARLARDRDVMRPVAWLRTLSPRVRTALVLVVLLIAPVLQSARGTSFLARETGAELRAPVPVALMKDLAQRKPWSVIGLAPDWRELVPGLEAMREGLSLDLRAGTMPEANVMFLTTPSRIDPANLEAAETLLASDVMARLHGATELARDARPGLIVSLWELTVPGPLDKRRALPHN